MSAVCAKQTGDVAFQLTVPPGAREKDRMVDDCMQGYICVIRNVRVHVKVLGSVSEMQGDCSWPRGLEKIKRGGGQQRRPPKQPRDQQPQR